MSSHTLSFKLPAPPHPYSLLQRSPVPIHVSFASHTDLFAVLWEPGILEVFDLKTRLGPGRSKVVDPVQVWSGTIDTVSRSYRQVVFDQSTGGDKLRLTVLGAESSADANDVVFVVEVDGPEKTTTEVPLPARNGRLIPAKGSFWEGPDGKVYKGQSHS